jgi:hypothetical protein
MMLRSFESYKFSIFDVAEKERQQEVPSLVIL